MSVEQLPVEKIEGEAEALEDFIAQGGEIIDYYPEDHRPKRWLCGRSEAGEIIDPPGLKKRAIHYLNDQGQWEAGNPDKKLLEEMKLWRSDMNNP